MIGQHDKVAILERAVDGWFGILLRLTKFESFLQLVGQIFYERPDFDVKVFARSDLPQVHLRIQWSSDFVAE